MIACLFMNGNTSSFLIFARSFYNVSISAWLTYIRWYISLLNVYSAMGLNEFNQIPEKTTLYTWTFQAVFDLILYFRKDRGLLFFNLILLRCLRLVPIEVGSLLWNKPWWLRRLHLQLQRGQNLLHRPFPLLQTESLLDLLDRVSLEHLLWCLRH